MMRTAYADELDQLRLQVELMAIRVDQNLERMRSMLEDGDVAAADRAVNADDAIDAMHVSLVERCYDLLCREHPVAGDLRFVVSVLRVIGEVERVGDLALRVVKLAPERERLASNPATFGLLLSLADEAVDRFRAAIQAWAGQNLAVATMLAAGSPTVEALHDRLTTELLRLDGPEAVPVAVRSMVAGRALDRIVDHTTIIGARMRYLITGDPDDLATEVR
jgi:phosphate transport system protein